MPSLTRRDALCALGTAGLGATLPALPAPARSVPLSLHQFTLGDATVSVVRDTGFALPPEAFGTNAPPGLVDAALRTRGLPPAPVRLDSSQLLVEHGGKRTLLDAGTGRGDLLAGLAALGVAPASVDHVVISHYHGDHLGGVSSAGAPTFPNAQVQLPAVELAFIDGFGGADDRVEVARAALSPVRDRTEPYADGDAVSPGVTAVAAPGHTPGHIAFEVTSRNDHLLVLSDALVHVLFAEHPHWLYRLDCEAEATVATRRRLLGRAADEGLPVFASHLPFPGLGRVARSGSGFRFTPDALR